MKGRLVNRMVMVILLLGLGTCGRASVPNEQIAAQGAKVDSARVVLQRERDLLRTMEDSLEARIAQNVELGMTAGQAVAVERARLDAQANAVKVAGSNLRAQEEYLGLLQHVRRGR